MGNQQFEALGGIASTRMPSWPATKLAPQAGWFIPSRFNTAAGRALNRLALPMSVRQAGTQPQPGQKMQPAHANLLIRTERPVDARSGLHPLQTLLAAQPLQRPPATARPTPETSLLRGWPAFRQSRRRWPRRASASHPES